MNQLVFISYLTLIFDNMLLTMVVPILPDYLNRIVHDSELNKIEANNLNSSSIYKFNHSNIINQSNIVSISGSNFHPLNSYAARAHRKLGNSKIGFLLAAHGFLQFMFNPIAGHSISRLGYTGSQSLGLILLLLSAFVYSISERFFYLVLARGLHGIGSSFLIISAMSGVAREYVDEEERCIQMGTTMSGIGAGVLIGYPFGGIMYQLFGKSTPFFIFIICLLVLLVLQLKLNFNQTFGPFDKSNSICNNEISFKELLSDLDILVVIITIGVSTMCIATLEPCLPVWLLNTFNPTKWQLGMAFIPDSIGYLLGTKYLSSYVVYFGKWTFSKMALILVALSAMVIPLVSSIYQLIIPHFTLGLSIGAIDAACMPMLAYIVDIKFEADYGLVYAISQFAVCTAYGVAPLLGSQLADLFGFKSLMRLLAFFNLSQAFVIHFLVKYEFLLSVDTDDRHSRIKDHFYKLTNKIKSKITRNPEYKEINSSNS